MNLNKKKYIHISVKIPENVTIEKKKHFLLFSGPLGLSTLNLEKMDIHGLVFFRISQQENIIDIFTISKPLGGLIKSTVLNKIQGVSRGFLIYLKIIGIGYRIFIQENQLIFKLGYSHDIIYKLPSSIKAFLIDPTLFCLFGIDKNQITQIAAKIRNLRKPSVYKGKGIRLLHENILLKAGKRK